MCSQSYCHTEALYTHNTIDTNTHITQYNIIQTHTSHNTTSYKHTQSRCEIKIGLHENK